MVVLLLFCWLCYWIICLLDLFWHTERNVIFRFIVFDSFSQHWVGWGCWVGAVRFVSKREGEKERKREERGKRREKGEKREGEKRGK